jgi:hypothetical protein
VLALLRLPQAVRLAHQLGGEGQDLRAGEGAQRERVHSVILASVLTSVLLAPQSFLAKP